MIKQLLTTSSAASITSAIDKIGYHVTTKDALPKILNEGLVGSAKSRHSHITKHISKAIYFSSSLRAAKDWIEMLASEEADAMAELVVLAVDLSKWKDLIKEDPDFTDNGMDDIDAFYIRGVNIPPKYIIKKYHGIGKRVANTTKHLHPHDYLKLLDYVKPAAPWTKTTEGKKTTLEKYIRDIISNPQSLKRLEKYIRDDIKLQSTMAKKYPEHKANLKRVLSLQNSVHSISTEHVSK